MNFIFNLFIKKNVPENKVRPIIYSPPVDDDWLTFSKIAEIVITEKRSYLNEDRLYVLWQIIRNLKNINGNMIEIGSFRGGSAKFIAMANDHVGDLDSTLTIIDTFEGHPDCIDVDKDRTDIHYSGKFSETDHSEVVEYLAILNVNVVKGDCLDVLSSSLKGPIKFAHVDVDLYNPILFSLNMIDKFLTIGGAVVVDDYSAPTCPGVEQAVAEFLRHNDNYSLWFFRTKQAVLIKQNRGLEDNHE